MYENKEIKKEIYQIIIPMILENILQISVSLITTAMVGRLMADAISAQGICVRITDPLRGYAIRELQPEQRYLWRRHLAQAGGESAEAL